MTKLDTALSISAYELIVSELNMKLDKVALELQCNQKLRHFVYSRVRYK